LLNKQEGLIQNYLILDVMKKEKSFSYE